MKKLQNQYLFLAREDITTVPELQNAVQALTARQKEAAREKSRLGKQKHRFQELFELAAKMEELEAAFHSYERGDPFLRKSIRIMRCVRRPWRKRDIPMRKSARSGSGLPGSMRKRLPGNGSSTGN